VRDFDDVVTRAYFRMEVEDRPGVLADITRVFGEHRVSIDSIVQKSVDAENTTAELVILTHPAPERVLQKGRGELEALDCVRQVSAFLRVQ
jgi:homoserine dehydrogenase